MHMFLSILSHTNDVILLEHKPSLVEKFVNWLAPFEDEIEGVKQLIPPSPVPKNIW